MINRLGAALVVIAALTLPLGTSPAMAAERLSISTWGSPQHYQVAEFVPLFEKLLAEKSDGEIRTRSFSGGEMVKQQFVATAVPQGTVDISLTTLDNWSGRVSDVSILTTPLWTTSMAWTRDNLKPGHPIFDYFDNKLRAEGAIIIAMFDIGPPVVSTSFEITGPESFEGKSIRVYSKGSGLIMEALGAAPTIIGVGDVYSTLQRRTVDGAMGGLGGAVGLQHYEVTSHMFVPNGVLGTLIHAYVMNKERFQALSPELQKTVMEASDEARDHRHQAAIDKYDSLLDTVREAGNTVTVVDQGGEMWNAFADKLEPLTAQARKDDSSEVVSLLAAD